MLYWFFFFFFPFQKWERDLVSLPMSEASSNTLCLPLNREHLLEPSNMVFQICSGGSVDRCFVLLLVSNFLCIIHPPSSWSSVIISPSSSLPRTFVKCLVNFYLLFYFVYGHRQFFKKWTNDKVNENSVCTSLFYHFGLLHFFPSKHSFYSFHRAGKMWYSLQ